MRFCMERRQAAVPWINDRKKDYFLLKSEVLKMICLEKGQKLQKIRIHIMTISDVLL